MLHLNDFLREGKIISGTIGIQTEKYVCTVHLKYAQRVETIHGS